MFDMKPKSDGPRSAGPPRGSHEATPTTEWLKLLRERFPHLRGLSLQLLEQDETFRELCEEHAACTEVIERLTHLGSDEAMLREYSALRLRIERELLDYLSVHSNSGIHR
jgi:hypothetical protein